MNCFIDVIVTDSCTNKAYFMLSPLQPGRSFTTLRRIFLTDTAPKKTIIGWRIRVVSVMSPLTDSARYGGRAYSGRMTKQSLTVQRSLLLSGLL